MEDFSFVRSFGWKEKERERERKKETYGRRKASCVTREREKRKKGSKEGRKEERKEGPAGWLALKLGSALTSFFVNQSGLASKQASALCMHFAVAATSLIEQSGKRNWSLRTVRADVKMAS